MFVIKQLHLDLLVTLIEQVGTEVARVRNVLVALDLFKYLLVEQTVLGWASSVAHLTFYHLLPLAEHFSWLGIVNVVIIFDVC